MTKRRRISATERASIFTDAGGVCHICGFTIDGSREAWEIEHIIPLEMGGDEAKGSTNLAPAHALCHRPKSAEDARHIAKAKRMQQRGVGIKRQPSSVVPGSKASRWKRKVDGTVVRR